MSDEQKELKKQQERWQNTKDLMKVKKRDPKLAELLQTYNSIFDKIDDEYNKTWDEINQLDEQYPYFKETPPEIEQRKKELNLKQSRLYQKKQELKKRYSKDVKFFKEDSSKIQKAIEKSDIVPKTLDEDYLKQIWEEKLAKETPERREQILKNVKQWQEQDPNYEPHLDRSNVTHMPEYEDLWEAQKKVKDSKAKETTDKVIDLSSLKKEKLAKQKALEQLPMDQASRMARAKDMGFDVDTTYYHGTPYGDIREFKKDSFFSEDPNFASTYSRAHQELPFDQPIVYPTHLNTKNVFDYENSEHIKKLEKSLIEKFKTSNVPAGMIEKLHSGVVNPASLSPEERARNIINILENLNKNKESNWNLLENNDINDAIKKAGFDGTFITESGRKNVMVFDPKNIRSTFAKFDPSKADSSDISSFVPKTTGEKAIGAAAKGLGYLDKGLTKLGHLGTAADFMQGNIPEAALDVTETAVAKYGSAGAARVLPFLELLRPTEMEPKDDVTSDIPMKPERFRKLKQLYNKEE